MQWTVMTLQATPLGSNQEMIIKSASVKRQEMANEEETEEPGYPVPANGRAQYLQWEVRPQ